MATIRRQRKVRGRPVKVDPNSPIGRVILEYGNSDIAEFEAEIKDALPDHLPLP